MPRHYLQSINGKNYDPKLGADSWRLVVDGLVDQPLTGLTYADITALPMQRQVLTMQCIGNLDWRAVGGQCRVGRDAAVRGAQPSRDQERGDPGQVLQRQL